MFLFQRRMVAAPEGAGAPAGGPAAPAAPAASAAAPSPGVRSPAAPAGDAHPFPGVFGRSTQPAPRAGDDDELEAAIREDTEQRGIPHDRVRKIAEGRARKAAEDAAKRERESLMRELSPYLQELEQLRGVAREFDPAAVKTGIAKSLLQALGVEEEKPAPKYVTEEEFQARLREDRDSFQREVAHREDMQRAQADLVDRKAKHKDAFEHFPMIEELAAAMWSSPSIVKAGVSYGQCVDAIVRQIDAGIAKRNETYAARKAAEAGEQPITPGSVPAPTGKPPGKIDHSPDGLAKRSAEFRKKALGVAE